MKKRGFTLIELLGLIIVLGLLAVITAPKVIDSINDSREKAYNNQINSLISAAKKWGTSNSEKLPDEESGEQKALKFSTLVDEGYIKQTKIINPKTDEELSGCIKISYDQEYSQYKYEYTDDKTFCGR